MPARFHMTSRMVFIFCICIVVLITCLFLIGFMLGDARCGKDRTDEKSGSTRSPLVIGPAASGAATTPASALAPAPAPAASAAGAS